MPTGPNWNAPGAVVGLWKLNFKVNTAKHGFNLGFHIAEKSQADAIAAGVKIAKHLLGILPTTAEVVFATVSKDTTTKDSKFIRGALGFGKFEVAGPPPETTYDSGRTSLLVRYEHADGGSVSMKLPALPDVVVTDEEIIDNLDDVANFIGPEPADPAVFTVWKDLYKSFVQVLILRTNFVRAGHLPGDEYTYFTWESAFPMRIVDKKGGRVFSL